MLAVDKKVLAAVYKEKYGSSLTRRKRAVGTGGIGGLEIDGLEVRSNFQMPIKPTTNVEKEILNSKIVGFGDRPLNFEWYENHKILSSPPVSFGSQPVTGTNNMGRTLFISMCAITLLLMIILVVLVFLYFTPKKILEMNEE